MLDIINFYLQGKGGLRATVQYAQKEHNIIFGSQSSLKRTLLNPALAGARVYGVSKMVPDPKNPDKQIRRHNKPGEYDEIIWDSHPALITRAQHSALIARATLKTERRQSVKTGQVRIVTGVGICGHCGKKLHSHNNGPKYTCLLSLWQRYL